MKIDTPAIRLSVPGFRAAGISAGIKKSGKKDLAVILSDVPAVVAGVFTTNRVKAAPVLFDMRRVKKGTSRGVVVNSGNANACTGSRGAEDTRTTVAAAEKALGLRRGELLVASTGVIGVPLPVEKITGAMPALAEALSSEGLADAATAIMTTDAFPKTCSQSARIGGKKVTVTGLAKGAGMICPDMATMLAFFVTDANINDKALKKALVRSVDNTFNSIIVDNDTSTNDTVLVFANAMSASREIKEGTIEFRGFLRLLEAAARKLAHMIVKDGEGATRFIEINVAGAATAEEARSAARTIAESMLVKTAFFGGDPNWGRIVAALGRAGVRLKQDKISISFNGVRMVRAGLDTGNEKKAAAAMKTPEVVVQVGLGAGKAASTVWTSDIGYEYVKINSEYRT